MRAEINIQHLNGKTNFCMFEGIYSIEIELTS